VIFTYVPTIYLLDLPPPSYSLLPLSPPLHRTISTAFILLFSYIDTKHIHHIHLNSPFLVSTQLPLVPSPRKDLFSPSAFQFFKVYIDSPRRFCLGNSSLYISCFNQINPSCLITYSFSITMLP
jgi:hypothetical protein